jgi:hypothetical protein
MSRAGALSAPRSTQTRAFSCGERAAGKTRARPPAALVRRSWCRGGCNHSLSCTRVCLQRFRRLPSLARQATSCGELWTPGFVGADFTNLLARFTPGGFVVRWWVFTPSGHGADVLVRRRTQVEEPSVGAPRVTKEISLHASTRRVLEGVPDGLVVPDANQVGVAHALEPRSAPQRSRQRHR